MKDTTKKVVILNNFSSPYVSEAIIILRDYDPRLEGKAIADAEKIVSDYMEKINRQTRQAPARKKSKIFKITVCLIIAAAAAAVCFLLR